MKRQSLFAVLAVATTGKRVVCVIPESCLWWGGGAGTDGMNEGKVKLQPILGVCVCGACACGCVAGGSRLVFSWMVYFAILALCSKALVLPPSLVLPRQPMHLLPPPHHHQHDTSPPQPLLLSPRHTTLPALPPRTPSAAAAVACRRPAATPIRAPAALPCSLTARKLPTT